MRYTQPSMERLFALAHPRRFRTVFRTYYVIGIVLNAFGAVRDYNVEPRSWPDAYPYYLGIRFLCFILLAIGLASTYNLAARHPQFAHFFTLACCNGTAISTPLYLDMIYLSLEYQRQLAQPTEDSDPVAIAESIVDACTVKPDFWLPFYLIIWYTSFPIMFNWAISFGAFQMSLYGPGWYISMQWAACGIFWQPMVVANMAGLLVAHGVGIGSILSKDVVERKMFALQHRMLVVDAESPDDEKGSIARFCEKSSGNVSNFSGGRNSPNSKCHLSVENLFGLRKLAAHPARATSPVSRQLEECAPNEDPSLHFDTVEPTTKSEPMPSAQEKKVSPVTQQSSKCSTIRELLQVLWRHAVDIFDPQYSEKFPDYPELEQQFRDYSTLTYRRSYRWMIFVIAVTDLLHNFSCGTACFTYFRLLRVTGTCVLGLLLSVLYPRRPCISSVVFGVVIATYIFDTANQEFSRGRSLEALLVIATIAAGSCGLRQIYTTAAFVIGGTIGLTVTICFPRTVEAKATTNGLTLFGEVLLDVQQVPFLEVLTVWLGTSVYGLLVCRNREKSLRDYFAALYQYTENRKKKRSLSGAITKIANQRQRSDRTSVSSSFASSADYTGQGSTGERGTSSPLSLSLSASGSEGFGQRHFPRSLKSVFPQASSIHRTTRASPDLSLGDYRDRRPFHLNSPDTGLVSVGGARNDAYHSDSDDSVSSAASVNVRSPVQKFTGAALSPEPKTSDHFYSLPGGVVRSASFDGASSWKTPSSESSPVGAPNGNRRFDLHRKNEIISPTERKAISLAKLAGIRRSKDRSFRENDAG